MYHQNSVDSIHFLHANKMAETLMRIQQHQQQGQDFALSSSQIGNDRQAAEPEGHHQYDQHQSPAVLNYASSSSSQQTQGTVSTSEGNEVPADCGGGSQSLFVVIPRIEYDFMKQELAGLRHTLHELKNTVNFEIHQLKADGRALKQRVDACLCSSNVHHNKDICSCQKSSTWGNEGGQQQGIPVCSPVASSPDLTSMDKPVIHGFRSYGSTSCGSFPMLGIFGNPGAGGVNNDMERNKLVQLLPNYDVWVNKLNLQITVNEAPTRKDAAALYLLRRVIPLVFSWEELACSRGQGLNCKTTDDVFGRSPLDPTKVMACKAFMRKFCADTGSPEPTERAVNQTFSHQVNYARRRIKLASQPDSAAYRPKKLRRSSMALHRHMDSGIDSTSSRNDQLQMPKTENYMQI